MSESCLCLERQGNHQSEKDIIEDKSTPIEIQIVGCNAAQDQYTLKSAGEIKHVDSSELFQRVSGGERESLFKESKIQFLDSQLHIKRMMICLSRKTQICL
jgi:hypothetical protein